MSRTYKGSKSPGWEPWSNREERQKPAPDDGYEPTDQEYEEWEDMKLAWECYVSDGCPLCKEKGQ